MKKTFVFVTCLFLLYSCQDNIQDLPSLDSAESIELRKKDCIQDFTPGDAFDDLFGNYYYAEFGQSGWNGSFENEYFPCATIQPAGDCCDDSEIRWFDILPPPFFTTCNSELDEQELQDLADEILTLSTADLPVCEDGTVLNPVDVNVIVLRPLCCVYEPPCDDYIEDPCECYGEYPNDIYWECCQAYILQVQVRYARTTDCRAIQ